MVNSFTHAVFGLHLTSILKLTPKVASSVLASIAEFETDEDGLINTYAELHPALPKVQKPEFENCKRLIEKTIKFGITVIPISDPLYPLALARIDDPPPVLYLRGDITVLDATPGLAVVGTRRATSSGLLVAERIAAHFAKKGWPIVSGLALGIDAAAHKGALNVDGKTIAVLAHGLNEVHPKTNKNLADEILQKGGAFVSEYPLGFPVRPEQFVLRNRIQVGLSAGSVIVEGEEKSGTKTQAEYCLRNRRQLFAVVPTEETARLNLSATLPKILVEKRGAVAIRSREDYDRVEMMISAKRAELRGLQE